MRTYKIYYRSNENEPTHRAIYVNASSAKSAAKKAIDMNNILYGCLQVSSGRKRTIYEISGGKIL